MFVPDTALPIRAKAAGGSAPPPFAINPDLDLDEAAAIYARDGRVRIWSLLSAGSEELHAFFEASPDWIHLISQDGGALELDRDDKARLGRKRWAEIETEALLRVRNGFQYRYEGLRVPEADELDDAEGNEDLVTAFARLMQSTEMLDLLCAVTGHENRMAFTDGQATAYGPGDFLTGHDDDVHGKNRLAAYVFGLTPAWRIEYGGLLLFHGPNERTAYGLAPRFNTLDLFKVPQQHSVSMVTPSAPHRRYAVTGWLRSGAGRQA